MNSFYVNLKKDVHVAPGYLFRLILNNGCMYLFHKSE